MSCQDACVVSHSKLNPSFLDLYGHFACTIADNFFADARHDGAIFILLPKLITGIAEQEKVCVGMCLRVVSQY
jgi:hypothetical protein